MHELSIAQSIMQIVFAEAGRSHARRVLKVSLKIGELSGVFPESLSFCFELLSRGTIVEGALFEIERVPLQGYCTLCDKRFLIENHLYRCRHCGSSKIELISGHELQVDCIEVEDETDPGEERYPCCP